MFLMMDIKIISAFSIVFLSLMVSNEFLEFLANIIYSCILFIVILFFYQNRKHFFNIKSDDNKNESKEKSNEVKIKYITKEITIENDEKSTIITKEQSPGSVRLIQNYPSTTSSNTIDNEILIKQLTSKNQDLSEQINLQIEKSRASELKYFNDSSKFENEIKEQISKIIKLTEKNESLLDSIMILNGSIDVLKSKIQDITKERDSIYANEQKLLIKLTNFEKKERELLDNEKQLKLKLSDSKDQFSQLKKEQDEKIKKIKQLENNIQSLESQISKILQKQEKEKEKQRREKEKEMEKSSSDSSLPSSLFSNSNNTPSKSIPIPTSSSTSSLISNNDSSSSISISPSSSLGKDNTSNYSDDSDRGEGSSPSEPKFKSLFNKVKSEFYSSKIVNKAQKGINKHLGSDFFTPTTNSTNNNANGSSASAAVISSTTTTITTSSSISSSSSSTTSIISTTLTNSNDNISNNGNIIDNNTSISTNNNNNDNEQQLEIIQDNSNKVKESPVKPLIFFDDLGSDILDSSNKEQIESIITVSPRDQPIQKEQSLSDLFIRGSGGNINNNLSLSSLDNLINNDNNNNNIEEQFRSATPPLQQQEQEQDYDQEEEQPENEQLKQLKELQQLQTPPQESLLQQIQQQQQDEEIIEPPQNLIKSFSIREEENKLGLRRAKKKPSPGCSTMMEDVSIGIFPFLKNENNSDIALFGVFDGHAGRSAAESASKLFPKELENLISKQNYLLDDGDQQDRSNLIIESFKNVDENMKDHEYEGCTCTISLVWKTKNNKRYLQVGNVGDSSAFLCRGDNNQAIELTFDHKANDPSEKQRIKDSGIPVSENQTRINGVAVSRSLGNHFIKEQNIGMISVPHISNCYQLSKKDKFMVIASDGLWDVINGQSAIDKVSSLFENGASSSEMASFLIETAVQSSLCKDNVTVIVVKF